MVDYHVPCGRIGTVWNAMLGRPAWDLLRARYVLSSDGRLSESISDETHRCFETPSRIHTGGARKDFHYPILGITDVEMDIDFWRWAVRRGNGETDGLEWLGRPLELAFGGASFARIASDGRAIHLEPHYEQSAWDYFQIDSDGQCDANALGGLIFLDLNAKHPEINHAGVVDVLQGAAEALEAKNPVPPEAAVIRTIIARIPPPA